MIEKTQKEFLEIWSVITILRDPAPLPMDDETIKNLKKVGKAFIEELKDLLRDITNYNYKLVKKINYEL